MPQKTADDIRSDARYTYLNDKETCIFRRTKMEGIITKIYVSSKVSAKRINIQHKLGYLVKWLKLPKKE